jgi:hypothetical protein
LEKYNLFIYDVFIPFFEIIIIKLAISRPRHFLGSHLYHQFYTNATAHLRQPSFNANQCWLSLPVDLLEEFGGKKTLARSQNQLNPVCSVMFKVEEPQEAQQNQLPAQSARKANLVKINHAEK